VPLQPVPWLRAPGGYTNDAPATRPLRWGGRAPLGVAAHPADAPSKAVALGKGLGVAWVVGVGCPPDLEVAFNSGAGQLVKGEHAALALFGVVADAEVPTSPCRGEVFALQPGGGFLGVASAYPAPQLAPDIIVELAEGRFGGSIAVVVGPATQQRVELTQERRLCAAQSGLDQPSDLVPQDLDFALCGGDQQFIPRLAQGVPQKVKARLDGSDDGLLL